MLIITFFWKASQNPLESGKMFFDLLFKNFLATIEIKENV